MSRGFKRALNYADIKDLFRLEVDAQGNPTLYRKNWSNNGKWKNKGEWLEVQCPNRHSSGYTEVVWYPNGDKYLKRGAFYHGLCVSLYTKRDIHEDRFVDHIDRDRTNNNLNNLRIVTARENSQNRARLVGYCYSRGKYVSHIKINNKQFRLGSFGTLEEAQQRYWTAYWYVDSLVGKSASDIRKFINNRIEISNFLENNEKTI